MELGTSLSVLQTHLLLGGAGFIGRHVAAGLLSKGHKVVIAGRGVQRLEHVFNIKDGVRLVSVDLNTTNWDALVDGADVVHHYAWSSIPASANANPLGDLTTNIATTVGVLEAVRRKGHGRVVFSSSGGTVYGRTNPVPIPETHPLAPVTAYGAGKATAELYLGLYRDLHRLDCRIARIANPYGAGQDVRRGLGAVTTFLQRALCDQEIVIWGDGTVTRDYIHISDVVNAMVALATAPSVGQHSVLNIGSGAGLSLNDIVTEVQRHFDRTLTVKRQTARSFDVSVNVLDVSNAKRVLDWQPQMPFAQGLERTLSDIAHGGLLSRLA